MGLMRRRVLVGHLAAAVVLGGCLPGADDAEPDAAASLVDDLLADEEPQPEPQPEPEPTDDPDASGNGDQTLRDLLAEEAPADHEVLAFYTDDDTSDQCLDLTGAAPTEIDCIEIPEIEDCVLVFLTKDAPLSVICAADIEAWGMDLGYEGAYTTADGQRGEFGLSCRVALPTLEGECAAAVGEESVNYEPYAFTFGAHVGLALVSTVDVDASLAAALDELAATTGLEGVLRSTAVVSRIDTEVGLGDPDAAWLGINVQTSLDQHRSIVEGMSAVAALEALNVITKRSR